MGSLAPITAEAWAAAATRSRYHRGRWAYLRHVAAIVEELAPARVLEVGAGPPPHLVPGSATLDVDPELHPTVLHDARETPWPIAPGAFDLVLGLQVWEHLRGAQAAAFAEARRVAGPTGHVLLSLPFRWKDTNATHRGIGARRVREWTGVEPIKRVLVRTPPERKRLVLLFAGLEG